MKARLNIALLAAAIVCLILKGSSDQLNLEDSALPLALCLDLDQNDELHIYTSSPVFGKNIKKKTHEIDVKARALRQSRTMQNEQSPGFVQGRNVQVILIGRRMLQHKDWFRLTDIFFRDARNTITDRMIAVDGPVSEIIYLNLEDQPMIPSLLRGMVDTKSAVSETANTTAQELRRQFIDTGITPSMAEIKLKNKVILLTGTTLLHKNGTYAASLGPQETVLLSILQKKAKPGVSFSYLIPGQPKSGPFETDTLSFSAGKIKTKIKTSYRQGRFQFDINIKSAVTLSERLFPYDVYKNANALEQKVAEQMEGQFESLIAKIQQHHIDPIGLGLYARSYEHKQYKKVEDHWADELSDAKIKVSVDIKIGAMGPVK
ncbi:Ger(x)C family spore germination protein [Cohnella silvisoli]|uniref:Ger(X)C family spore germination protein n=1 Tax=Cohnella silvisoli TaxID=2873699 RepID=A0ABV1KZS6_9BACL|nr:Ger(x)C family spore germination protein [Cohnella silvisoli]MCD9024965.1 Ger(x)C family spore germination protein [Cohnella silvisoli]